MVESTFDRDLSKSPFKEFLEEFLDTIKAVRPRLTRSPGESTKFSFVLDGKYVSSVYAFLSDENDNPTASFTIGGVLDNSEVRDGIYIAKTCVDDKKRVDEARRIISSLQWHEDIGVKGEWFVSLGLDGGQINQGADAHSRLATAVATLPDGIYAFGVPRSMLPAMEGGRLTEI